MLPKDTFNYYKSTLLPGVTVLSANIASFKYKKHAHEDYAIGLNTKGYHYFYCSGEYHKMPPGGIIQINPEEIHDGYANDQEGYSYYMLYVAPQLFSEVINDFFQNKVIDFRLKETEVFNNELSINLLKLVNEIARGNQEQLFMNELLLSVLVPIINCNASLLIKKKLMYKDPIIIKVKDFIRENLDQNLKLDDICKVIGISKFYLVRLFKNTTGITPYQYLLDCKVNAARRELEKGIESLTVVEKYGFYDLGHFTRRFKEVYGATPGKFQKGICLSNPERN